MKSGAQGWPPPSPSRGLRLKARRLLLFARRATLAIVATFACTCGFAQDQLEVPKSLEASLTVKCLLLPSIRKLGPGQIFTMPGQLIKSTTANCKSRGGKSVLFDMADPPTALSGALADPEKHVIPTVPNGLNEEARVEAVKRFSQVRSRRVLTSGGIAPAWDVSFGGILFARALLDVLDANESVLNGRHLFDNLEGRVIKASREIREREERSRGKSPIMGDQPPDYAVIQSAGDRGGNFIFVPASN